MLFRAICKAAQGAVCMQGEGGKISISQSFAVRRGVIQGDIISPILFITALDQLIQQIDKSGQGISVGKINELRVLGYADDATMISPETDQMSERLTAFSSGAKNEADMTVKMSKTFS